MTFDKFWKEINADSHYGLPIFEEKDKHVAEFVYDAMVVESENLAATACAVVSENEYLKKAVIDLARAARCRGKTEDGIKCLPCSVKEKYADLLNKIENEG